MKSIILFLICLVALSVGCRSDEAGTSPADGDGDIDADADGDTGTNTEAGPYCEPQERVIPTENFFADISDSSGIRDENFDPDPPAGTAINDHSRLGFADINGDGFDDIVCHSLFPNVMNGLPYEHLVFLNNGDGTFENFSDESGLRNIQSGFFAFGDVDNDGDIDAFAGYDLPNPPNTNTMLLNDGEGHFTPLSSSGIEGRAGAVVSGNAVFADFNSDGNLDLFIGQGHSLAAAYDILYLGNGDGTFNEAFSNLSGNGSSPSNGSVACDYDNDGDLDIFVSVYGVSNGGAQNYLYENDGAANFTNVAADRGFASLSTGNYFIPSTGYGTEDELGGSPGNYTGGNGFGLQCEDFNNDGLMDIFLTQISHPRVPWSDPSALLLNLGPDEGYSFENVFLDRGIPFNEGDVDGAMIDFDNDGLMDLSISRTLKYEESYTEEENMGWFGLMRQLDDGTFESMGRISGINDPNLELGRMKEAQNHAWSDIDNDGDLDLLVGGRDLGGGRPNFLFENQIGSQNMWMALRIQGDGQNVNSDGIGTRVTLRYDDQIIMREVKSSRGMYNSIDTWVLHFGIGDLGCHFEMEVRWPDGTTTVFQGNEVPINSYGTLTYPDILSVD